MQVDGISIHRSPLHIISSRRPHTPHLVGMLMASASLGSLFPEIRRPGTVANSLNCQMPIAGQLEPATKQRLAPLPRATYRRQRARMRRHYAERACSAVHSLSFASSRYCSDNIIHPLARKAGVPVSPLFNTVLLFSPGVYRGACEPQSRHSVGEKACNATCGSKRGQQL
jgi:hypothetical protein